MRAKTRHEEIVIALAGNPNSGKTTVFNELTGSRQHVGNWPGVTVERKEGFARRDGARFRVVDLPGIYSLAPYSQEETIARDFLLDNKVNVIVNIVDAGNLERNLYLTIQLLELGIPTVIALNMVDMAQSLGQWIDVKRFASLLGAQVVPTVGNKGEGMDDILDAALAAAACAECEPPRSARHSPEVEFELAALEERIRLKENPQRHVPLRWLLVKSLEGDREAKERLAQCAENAPRALEDVERTRHHLESGFGDDMAAVIADGRYGFIGGLLREVVTHTPTADRISITDKIDSVLLNRVLGLPIFLALMWLTFELTFDVGGIFVGLMEKVVSALSVWAASALPPGPLSSLIEKGVIGGVGGVVVFLPNIAIMFVIISFLEDSGYMARAAFLMDRSMHLLGLHGKSFIPLLMGFGCNVPAVMATRTLESREDRILTILINPLMSCTARLPIYVLFASIFFSRHGALVIFSIYALGIVLAVVIAKIFRRIFFPKAASPFVMELPPYRPPTAKGTVIHVWERASLFLSKAGTVILAASVVIWALGSLPWGVQFASEGSLVGRLGRLLEPFSQPLGMDWRAAVALFFGIGAKEIVVSTLGVLYGIGGGGLAAAFSPLTAYVFMVVSLIYVPCIATIAAIRRETGSWCWTLFAVGYTLVLAYAVGFVVFRLGSVMGFG